MDDKKHIINWSGKEYIEYKEWQKKNPLFKKLDTYWVVWAVIMLFSIVAIIFLLSSLVSKPIEYHYITIGQFVIDQSYFLFIGFLIAISWLLHGFGFILIKR